MAANNDYSGAGFGAIAGLLTAGIAGGAKWLSGLQRERGRFDDIVRRLEHFETKMEDGFSETHGRITVIGDRIARLEGHVHGAKQKEMP